MKKQVYDSVWDAIEDDRAVAENMKARSELMATLTRAVRTWGGSQAAAAKRLGITQPRLNDLLRGRIENFSLDALVNLCAAAGYRLEFRMRKAA